MTNKVKQRKKKDQEGSEIWEDPNAIAEKFSKTEEFVRTNRVWILSIGVFLILLIAGYLGFKYYQTTQNQIAQEEMFQAIYYYEDGNLNEALNGDGNHYGFLDIIDEYKWTDAANLAHYYTGVIYLKQGQYESAISHLNDFNGGDLLVQARAYSLIGDAYMEMENFQEAASYYERAAEYRPNKYFSPQYWEKAALAYENAGQMEEALRSYQAIIDNYPEADNIQEAKKHHARLEALASN